MPPKRKLQVELTIEEERRIQQWSYSRRTASQFTFEDGSVKLLPKKRKTETVLPLLEKRPALIPTPSSVGEYPPLEVPRSEGDVDAEPNEAAQDKAKGPSQTTQSLRQFVEQSDLLLELLMEHESDRALMQPCACGRGSRTTKCYDCSIYAMACEECFIDRHRTMPFHWANVWTAHGFFKRQDISTLRQTGYAIPLGHCQDVCHNPSPPVKFTVAHSNGIHATLVTFCNCFGSPSRTHQLMRARLFPSSVLRPIAAYTFTLLKQYDLHSLQGKVSAYDYYQSLRRLTDNTFTHLVNNHYAAFLVVARMWRYLKTLKGLGQQHNIDAHMPHRPKGTLIVSCPACPDPGLNMEGEWWRTPAHLRHLIQKRSTSDRNFQCSQFRKNTDPHDESVFQGHSYFPEERRYKEYMASLGPPKPEETDVECNHIKVVANQHRAKRANTAISGIVNTQCDHVFIMSSADMILGEGFGVVDMSSSHGFRLLGFHDGNTDDHRMAIYHKHSYDAQCQYRVHIAKRFAKSSYLSDQKDFIRRFERGIPDLHIKGHKEECTAIYGMPYHWCVGHFYGETAEDPWVEFNQVGGFTRQMNGGHRTDVLIAHFMDWNWRKVVNISDRLKKDLELARIQYQVKRDYFRQLSQVYASRAPAWSQQPLIAREEAVDGKTVYVSPFHRRPEKIPSLQALLTHLSAEDTAYSVPGDSTSVGAFFRAAFDAERSREKIKEHLRIHKQPSLESDASLLTRRETLSKTLERLRALRLTMMPQAGALIRKIVSPTQRGGEPEDEILGLPSDFTEAQRNTAGLGSLATTEIKLREALANELVSKVKSIARAIGSMLIHKETHIQGQHLNTRSTTAILTALAQRDRTILSYNANRDALIRLGAVDPSQDPEQAPFPHMSPKDTYRLPVDKKRQTGDSRRLDGNLWRLGVAADLLAGVELDSDLPVGIEEADTIEEYVTATSLTQRKTGPRSPKKPKQKASGPTIAKITEFNRGDSEDLTATETRQILTDQRHHIDGWLWKRGVRKTMNTKEIEAWEEEGDCIQWMRAMAEMYRWMEHFEIKHAEFERTIAYFQKMASCWETMSMDVKTPGHTARANRQRAMFLDFAKEAERTYKCCGHPDFIAQSKEDTILADRVVRWRSGQLKWMETLNIRRMDLDAPYDLSRQLSDHHKIQT